MQWAVQVPCYALALADVLEALVLSGSRCDRHTLSRLGAEGRRARRERSRWTDGAAAARRRGLLHRTRGRRPVGRTLLLPLPRWTRTARPRLVAPSARPARPERARGHGGV